MPKAVKNCLAANKGSLLVRIVRTDPSSKQQTVGKPLPGIKLRLQPDDSSKTTGASGAAQFQDLVPGQYQVSTELSPDQHSEFSLSENLVNAAVTGGNITTVAIQATRLARLAVKVTAPENVADALVSLSGPRDVSKKTGTDGVADFGSMPIGAYHVKVGFPIGTPQRHMYPEETAATAALARGDRLEHPVRLTPLRGKVFLRLSFTLPDGTVHALPADLRVRLRLHDNASVDGKLDATGRLVDGLGADVEIARNRKFTLEFPSARDAWIVFEKAGQPATQEIIVDADPRFDSSLGQAIRTGKRCFRWLGEDTALRQLDADAGPCPHYTEPDFAFTDAAAIGTTAAPVPLALKPKWQFLRFEYLDPRYAPTHHRGLPTGVPPLLLQGARQAENGLAPSLEAGSNFTLHGLDRAKSCQALPWLTVKDPEGKPLPDLTGEMLLEFRHPGDWVYAKSRNERGVVHLDPADPNDRVKVQAGLDRNRYYDLPAVWKSTNYFTRLPGGGGKFFDELSRDEIKASFADDKPLVFSLDDIVLVNAEGVQKAEDRTQDESSRAVSQHSRFALLRLDSKDGFRVKIHDPEDNGFHSKARFVKEQAGGKFRNYIAAPPDPVRVVVFCNGFHHLFDKRAAVADLSAKQVLGARAAKLDDPDCSYKTRFDTDDAVNRGYVHRKRVFDQHFLHYAAADDTTVYHAAISFWSMRIFSAKSDRPKEWDGIFKPPGYPLTGNPVDVRNFRDQGVKNAMRRWNEKAYRLERADLSADVVIIPFIFLEAKDVEDPPGNFHRLGGKAHCYTGIGTGRSGATMEFLFMNKDGYRDGDAKGFEPNPDYAQANPEELVLAHEVGHAVIGLWDDYITQEQYDVPGFQEKQSYPGVAYFRDEAGIMYHNQVVRLRQFWGRARWINDEAKPGARLNAFLKGISFHLAYAPVGKTKLTYALPDEVKNFWHPLHSEDAVKFGEKGKAALHLYPMGRDEFAARLGDGACDGMLVVDTRIKVEFAKGLVDDPLDWAAGTAFNPGNIIDFEAEYYVCKTAHTAGKFSADAGHWQRIDLDEESVWKAGQTYSAGKIIRNANDYHVSIAYHEAGDPIGDNWVVIQQARGNWNANVAYLAGESVDHNGDAWICKAAHTSGAPFDATRWVKKTADKGNYRKLEAYQVGDVASRSICVRDHTSGSIAADIQAGRLLACKAKTRDWVESTDTDKDLRKKNALAHLNKIILIETEDYNLGPDRSNGRFVLKRAANAFKQIYVRSLIQFHAGDGETKGGPAHFTLKVKRTVSKGFRADKESITISGRPPNEILARFLYGGLSDVAGIRESQNPADGLSSAEISLLKPWVEAKLGGAAFTVFDGKAPPANNGIAT